MRGGEVILALLGACMAPANPENEGPFFDEPATIAELWFGCDEKAAHWNLVIDTEHWTHGGHLYMGKDAKSIESHRVYSESAAADGSTDHLELELGIVADFRDAQPGATSAWLCSDEAALSFMVTVDLADGSDVADCRTWGVDPKIFEDPCDLLIDPPKPPPE
jgi:hypothetical protein